ncbi:MAG: hypothetical protein M3445_03770 [Actinomycetota bacterium]|nr:hypothetical protein [Actinomycetota bacterium]
MGRRPGRTPPYRLGAARRKVTETANIAGEESWTTRSPYDVTVSPALLTR